MAKNFEQKDQLNEKNLSKEDWVAYNATTDDVDLKVRIFVKVAIYLRNFLVDRKQFNFA